VPYASEGEGLHLPPVPEALNRCVLRKQVPGAAPPSDAIKHAAPTFSSVQRVRVPHGVKLMPHRHPEDRVYTVISGVFYIGLGEHAPAGPNSLRPNERRAQVHLREADPGTGFLSISSESKVPSP